MIINKNNLFKLQKKFGWKGSGLLENPIIIDSIKLETPNENFLIEKISNYLIIRDIFIKWITIENCKNITIENCKIFNLWIHTSSNLLITNNYIHYLALDETKATIIEKNKLHKKFGNIESIREGVEQVSKTVDKYCLICIIILISITSGFVVFGLISELIFSHKTDRSLSFLVFVPMLATIIPSIYLLNRKIQKKELDKLPENVIQNNESMDLNEMFKTFF